MWKSVIWGGATLSAGVYADSYCYMYVIVHEAVIQKSFSPQK